MKSHKKLQYPWRLGHVAVQLVKRYYAHDVGRDSAALTYYLLFAIFPLLILVSTILGILHLNVDLVTNALSQFIPHEVVNIVEMYLDYVSNTTSRELFWFSLVFSIWFPMRATSCLMHSVRKAFAKGAPETILGGQIRTFLFSLGLIFTMGLTFLMIMFGRRALNFLSRWLTIPQGFIGAWNYLRFVIMGVIMALALALLYMLAQGERRPLRETLPGVCASLVAWMLLSLAFSYYVEHFAHYAELYGSIATIVVVLLWLYMSGTVLIMGAELSGTLLEQRKKVWSSAVEDEKQELQK